MNVKSLGCVVTMQGVSILKEAMNVTAMMVIN